MSAKSSEDDINNAPGEINEEEGDNERDTIKSELSNLSFEELQKLKERLGAKVYKEAMFGKSNKDAKEGEKKTYKRENSNRPRERSSKIPVPMINNPIVEVKKKKEVRDPRFDPLCGEFDKKQFNENYNFLSEIRFKDIKATKAELKQTTDPEKQIQLRRLLQRLNEQHRTSRKSRIEKEALRERKKTVEEEFIKGRQPHFKNKSERRVESLVQQFEELKQKGAGRVRRHLKRRQQKIKKKSHGAPAGLS